jgi:hypothetical protein
MFFDELAPEIYYTLLYFTAVITVAAAVPMKKNLFNAE